MSESHGRHVWYELLTTDTGAAKAFYTTVVGWGAQDAGMPGVAYTLFTTGQTPVAGLMDLEAARQAGAPPSWTGYVAVDDVDATADRAGQLGGKVCVPPCDIPNVGRFSIIADPQGAAFGLLKPNPGQNQEPAEPMTPGHVGWHELSAADWQKAFAFYSELFGWQKADAIDMGEMGTYQLFSFAGQPTGGMFNKPPTVPAPYWLYYVTVGDIDAALERAKAGGGQILLEPMEVPGGAWIIQGRDPKGAMFALVGKRS